MKRRERGRCSRGMAVPTLLETQRALRAALFPLESDPLDEPLDPALPLDPLSVAIHRNTCQRTLLNSLRVAFPAVERLVGAEFLEGAARAFIERHLPSSACLSFYGAEWPEFLADFAPAADVPYLAEVARLEWAVNVALHAEEAAGLELARLAGLDEPTLASLRFTPHPSLTLLELRYPADRIWQAVLAQDDAAMAAVDLASGPVHLLVARRSAGVEVTRLTRAAWVFTARLAARLPLETALDAAAADAGARETLLAVFAEHLASGRLVDFECGAQDASSCDREHRDALEGTSAEDRDT